MNTDNRPCLPWERVLRLTGLVLLASPAAAQTTLTGNVYDGSGGPLLSGQVYQTTGFTVPSNQTLTLEPGAILKVDGGAITLFGEFVTSSTTDPAFVTSIHEDILGGDTNGNGNATSPAPGDWGGFRVLGSGSLTLDGVEMRWGGGGGIAPVNMEGGTLELRDCQVVRALEEGIDLRRPANAGVISAVENCAIIQSGTYAVDGASLDDMAAFSVNEHLANTLGDYIRVTDASLASDTTITLDNIPNLHRGALVIAQTSAAMIPAAVTLTVEPQVVIKWEDSVPALQRAFNVSGTLRLRGSRGLPVVVTSFSDDEHGGDTNEDGASAGSSGDWRGLHALAGGTIELEHALLRFGGNSGRGSVQSDGGFLQMWKVVVEHSEAAGMSMSSSSGGLRPRPDVQRCTFRDNGTYPIDAVNLQQVPGFRDNKAQGNGLSDAMRVTFGRVEIDSQIEPDNYPGGALFVDGPIQVRQAVLTLMRGTVLKANNVITIGAFETPSTLHCRGTGFLPVVITSVHDDAVGGDLMKDGSATAPDRNDWTGMTFSPGSSGSMENVLLRYGNSSVTCTSPDVSLRSVRVEHDGNRAFYISELDGDAENLVAFDSLFQGIHLAGGSFDLVHATIVNSGDHGVLWFPNHTGVIRNTIVWGSGNQNYASANENRIFNSNGVAGTPPFLNGNLSMDPLFVDQLGGDLNLLPGSPCIDTADYATAVAVVKDHEEFSRLLDPTLSGNLRADIGAYEHHRWRMEVIGRPHIGSTMILEVQGPAPGFSFFSLSFADVPVLQPLLGFQLIGDAGLPASSISLGTDSVNTPHLVRIPNVLSLVGLEFGIQAATLTSSVPYRGEWNNLYRACILPKRPGKPQLINIPPEFGSGGTVQLR